jgi:adenylyltransferase/sulfurtransferase
MSLSAYDAERFSRNILLSGIGEEGQNRLSESRVLITGVGGLGSPAAFYCAAAGIGTIGLADGDIVDLSNLQRQIIHNSNDIGTFKVVSAERKLRLLYPEIRIIKHETRINEDNAASIIKGYQFVIDATDNFKSKFMINDVCVSLRIPFSHAGVHAFNGQLMTVLPGKSACYRCVFGKEPPADKAPTSSRLGILGSVAGVVGSMQATECIKYLCGLEGLLVNRMLMFDGKTMDCRTVNVKRDTECKACSQLVS